MLKRIISLLLALTLVFTLGVTLVSCSDENADNGNGAGDNNDGGSTDTKDTYTITVKDANGNEIEIGVVVGDKVIINKYAGTQVKLGEEEFIIVRGNDILAVIVD